MNRTLRLFLSLLTSLIIRAASAQPNTARPTLFDGSPMQGVDVYDLLLISKHTLGVRPLGSPYKMIAADANKSQSINFADILDIRKLILGIHNEFPDNTSWRFVDANHEFAIPENPFDFSFPTFISETDADSNSIAVKVGDMNDSALASSRPIGTQTIGFPAMKAARSSEYLTVPVAYTGDAPLEAFQLGLKFDPNLLEFVGTSQGEVEGFSPDMFGLTKAKTGEIRVAWFLDGSQPAEPIRPSDVLFYLTFKSKRGIQDLAAALGTDDAVLANRAWAVESGGQEYAVVSAPAAVRTRSSAESANGKLAANCRPNPTSGAVTFAVQTQSAQTVRVSFSARGGTGTS